VCSSEMVAVSDINFVEEGFVGENDGVPDRVSSGVGVLDRDFDLSAVRDALVPVSDMDIVSVRV
jgi:hypothetical protein